MISIAQFLFQDIYNALKEIRHTYPFKNTFFIVTEIHKETDLPACVTVNGIHLNLAAVTIAHISRQNDNF